MWLPWQIAVGLAVGLGGFSLHKSHHKLAPIAREAAIILALYALWIRAGEFEPLGVKGGHDRGLQVWHLEQRLHLPSELWVQKQFVSHSLLMQASNIYYAVAHVPAAIALLVWMFFRHRVHYQVLRTALACVTGVSLLMHYVPVAPPRLYPQLGFIDTALLYKQSVYGEFGAGVSSQLAAMPSVHVEWAVLVGVSVFVVSSSRWRWLAVAHTFVTILVVTNTANHWWMDGIVGIALLVPSYLIARVLHRKPGGSPASVADQRTDAVEHQEAAVRR